MAKKKKKKAPAKKATKKAAKKKPAKKVAKKKTAKKAVKKMKAKSNAKPAKKAAKKIAKKSAAPKKATTAKLAAPKTAAPKAAKAPAAEAGPHRLLGEPAPHVALPNQEGNTVDVAEALTQGTFGVLYFYPKDDTPGCTTEACNFRDNMNTLKSHGVTVLGVSPDPVEDHKKFAEKFNLNFDLLADTNRELAEKYGVWKLKKFMGREYMGVERTTFLFKDGKIVKAWQPVKVEGHVDEILNNIEQAQS